MASAGGGGLGRHDRPKTKKNKKTKKTKRKTKKIKEEPRNLNHRIGNPPAGDMASGGGGCLGRRDSTRTKKIKTTKKTQRTNITKTKNKANKISAYTNKLDI